MIKINKLLLIIECTLALFATGCSLESNTNPAGKYTASNGSYIIISESNTWYGKINEKSIATGIDWAYSYEGTINEKNELIITNGETRRVMPGGGLVDGGSILGELVGNEIHSGGLILNKQTNTQTNKTEKQYKRSRTEDVRYVQIFDNKVVITKTKSKYNVSSIKFTKKGLRLIGQNGRKNGVLLYGLFGVRVIGVEGFSGYYWRGNYTYETGPWPNEKIKK